MYVSGIGDSHPRSAIPATYGHGINNSGGDGYGGNGDGPGDDQSPANGRIFPDGQFGNGGATGRNMIGGNIGSSGEDSAVKIICVRRGGLDDAYGHEYLRDKSRGGWS